MADLDLQITTDSAGKLISGIIDDIHEDKGVIVAIGKTSHGETNGRAALKSQYDQYEWECNWVVSLYVTGDYTEIEEVCRTAQEYVREVTGETPPDHGDVVESRKKHHVFALVHRNIRYEENYSERPNLVGSVSAYLRGNPKSEFYIGITSGPIEDAIPAMIKRRTGDNYKDMHGINRMIAIFKSERQQECRDVEKELVEHYKGNAKKLNRTGGGGGRPTTQPWSFVYLGMHV